MEESSQEASQAKRRVKEQTLIMRSTWLKGAGAFEHRSHLRRTIMRRAGAHEFGNLGRHPESPSLEQIGRSCGYYGAAVGSGMPRLRPSGLPTRRRFGNICSLSSHELDRQSCCLCSASSHRLSLHSRTLGSEQERRFPGYSFLRRSAPENVAGLQADVQTSC